MNLLLDVLVELVGGAGSAETERGLVGTFTAGAAVLLIAAVLIVGTDSFGHAWAFGTFAGSVIVGALGVFLATLHWKRNRDDWQFAALSFGVNIAALAFSLLWLVAR